MTVRPVTVVNTDRYIMERKVGAASELTLGDVRALVDSATALPDEAKLLFHDAWNTKTTPSRITAQHVVPADEP